MKSLREKINELDCFENELIEREIIYYRLEFIEHGGVFCEDELKSMIRSITSLTDVINCLLCSLSLYFNSFSALSAVVNSHRSPLPNVRRIVISGGS